MLRVVRFRNSAAAFSLMSWNQKSGLAPDSGALSTAASAVRVASVMMGAPCNQCDARKVVELIPRNPPYKLTDSL